MSSVGPIEWRKDVLGERFYASRNYNDIAETYKLADSNRTQLDWNLTLRQQRKKGWSKGMKASTSAPNLLTAELKQRDPQPGHPDGPYHSTSGTLEKYQNFAGTVHMLKSLNRVSSSGIAHTIDWQVNLRDGSHQQPDKKWRRYYSRPQQSFDMMAENCAASNQEYQSSGITPQDRRPDRRKGAISIEMVRDDPISFRRNPGCEGTQVGQWEHLIQDRRYGHKARRQLGHETTLRSDPSDPNGARIEDTRSNGCIVEMLGKKKWTGHIAPDFMSAQPPQGDHKLHHLSLMRIQTEPNEENRELRKNKQPRTDAAISEKHTGEIRKKEQGDVM